MLTSPPFEPAPPRNHARVAALTAAGALVPAAILAATTGGPLLLAAIPAVTFGIPALTAPALYVGVSLTGVAPPPLTMLRAVGRALIAFAITQLGLAVPAAFLVATASPATGHGIVAATVALAALVGVFRLRSELAPAGDLAPSRWLVEWTWLAATAAIAIRLYLDVAGAVT